MVEYDSLGCCDKILNSNTQFFTHDTTLFKYFYYKSLCSTGSSFENYNSNVDSFDMLIEKFKYGGTESIGWKYRSANLKKINSCQKRLYAEGYLQALTENDLLKASDYAARMSKCYSNYKDRKARKKWQNISLSEFQRYAGQDYLKLIGYHKSVIFNDTTRIIRQSPPFKGYNHLVDVISKSHNSGEFKTVLEKGIDSGEVVSFVLNGRTEFKYLFNIEESSFEYYDDEISKFYMSDTVLIDTFTVFRCFGENATIGEQIEIVRDTILNQIPDIRNISAYKLKLKNSILFGILQKLKN